MSNDMKSVPDLNKNERIMAQVPQRIQQANDVTHGWLKAFCEMMSWSPSWK